MDHNLLRYHRCKKVNCVAPPSLISYLLSLISESPFPPWISSCPHISPQQSSGSAELGHQSVSTMGYLTSFYCWGCWATQFCVLWIRIQHFLFNLSVFVFFLSLQTHSEDEDSSEVSAWHSCHSLCFILNISISEVSLYLYLTRNHILD